MVAATNPSLAYCCLERAAVPGTVSGDASDVASADDGDDETAATGEPFAETPVEVVPGITARHQIIIKM